MLPGTISYKPFLIAWNLTRQCNLRCGHCYIDAGYPPLPHVELTLEEGFRLIDDTFRGYPGAWRQAVEAIERCRRHGLPFQVHHSVMSFNWADVWEMVEFAHYHGARVVNFFFMVCTGRGERLTDITPEQYEEVLSTLIDLQAKYPGMMIRARCAPHFKRIAYQKDPHSPITKAEGYMGGGCLSGSHYCRIAPDGEVTPCPYMPLSVGNVRDERFPEIWENAPVFKDLRGWQLKGKCGECEFEDICGGCRARPYASHGDYLDEDLWCQYKPGGGEKIGVAEMKEGDNVIWTKEAEERLNRLPFFLRGMIKGNVEKHAKGHGISSITPELLDELRRKRFGDKMPDMAGMGASDISEPVAGVIAGDGVPKNGKFVNPLPWTREALRRLDDIPVFLQDIFREVAEEFARDKGHLEVNVEVWDRLEEVEDCRDRPSGLSSEQQRMEWTEDALRKIETTYIDKPAFARDFMVGIIKEDIEMFARSKGITRIDGEALRAAAGEGKVKVEWSPEAWERLQKAPAFIRSGIKKAAEKRAR